MTKPTHVHVDRAPLDALAAALSDRRVLDALCHGEGTVVDRCASVAAELGLIDLPPATSLPLGHDVIDGPEVANFAVACYRQLVASAPKGDAGRGRERAQRRGIAERIAELGRLFGDAGWNEVGPELARSLFGDRTYLISADRAEAVYGFLGSSVIESTFVPESSSTERRWRAHLASERDLLDRELHVDPPTTAHAAVRQRPDLAGLRSLVDHASYDAPVIALCRSRSGARPGPLPCLGLHRGSGSTAVLIRDDAPAVRSPVSWRDHYALTAAYGHAVSAREVDVERTLILTDGACA
jgi:hypothetical protein